MELSTKEKLERLERLAEGKEFLKRRLGPKSIRLNPAEKVAFKNAKESGYIVRKGEMPNIGDLWYMWCSATQQPYLSIICHRRYAYVEFELQDHTMGLTEEGQKQMHQALVSFSSKKHCCFSYSPCSCGHDSIPMERAEDFAKVLLRIAKDHNCPGRSQEWSNSR